MRHIWHGECSHARFMSKLYVWGLVFASCDHLLQSSLVQSTPNKHVNKLDTHTSEVANCVQSLWEALMCIDQYRNAKARERRSFILWWEIVLVIKKTCTILGRTIITLTSASLMEDGVYFPHYHKLHVKQGFVGWIILIFRIQLFLKLKDAKLKTDLWMSVST